MREVGRNDPCSCGSGRKHKRCCLDLAQGALRIAREAEERIRELGEWVRDEHLDAWRAAYERELMPLNDLGAVPAEHADWLDTWLVCDAPVVDGVSPLEALAPTSPSPADAWLRPSQIGGWWLRGNEFPLPAKPWREDQSLTLHSEHEPLGAAVEGALQIARALEVQAGHLASVGRPVVVHEAAVEDVLAVLADDPARALCAALRWPEVREHTAEGQLVQQCYRRYRLLDLEAALAAMRACADATERYDLLGYWEDDTTFTVAGAPRSAPIIEPAPERGVVWELCDEDRADPPVLGEVTVSPDDAEFALNAVTPEHTDRLMAALPPQVRAILGELTSEHLDIPEVLTRVSRDRLQELVPVR